VRKEAKMERCGKLMEWKRGRTGMVKRGGQGEVKRRRRCGGRE